MKIINRTFALIIPLFFSSIALAGQYSESGYISEVKVNIQGSECDVSLSNAPRGKLIQRGNWTCNSIMGQNLLNIAKLAKAMEYRVIVVFEGNGEYSKPIYAIEIQK